MHRLKLFGVTDYQFVFSKPTDGRDRHAAEHNNKRTLYQSKSFIAVKKAGLRHNRVR